MMREGVDDEVHAIGDDVDLHDGEEDEGADVAVLAAFGRLPRARMNCRSTTAR